MKTWIVIDLDGTLCDCSHRVHLAQAKQWDEFHAGIQEDEPHTEAVTFLEVISVNYEILICTGRKDRYRDATVRWLNDKGLGKHITAMLMRPDKDRSSDHELKPRLVDEFFGSRQAALAAVLLVLDDRDRVVEAWRDAGFKCWQVQVGSY